MLFLHAALLAGLAAIAVPIIIHLWNRRSPKIVHWGAMQFLRSSINRRTRRIRLEEALLLACRCLLIGLIVLAVARPFSPPGSQIPWGIVLPAVLLAVAFLGAAFAYPGHSRGRHVFFSVSVLLFVAVVVATLLENRLHLSRFTMKNEQDIVLVVDTSVSTRRSAAGGGSVFDQLIDDARVIVARSSAGSNFAVLTTTPGAPPPIPLLTPDKKRVDAALRAIEPRDTGASIPRVLDSALSILAESQRATRILFLTDSQSAGWDLESDSGWRALQEAAGEAKPPALAIHRMPPPEAVRNLAVTGIEFSREVIGSDRPAGIIATIRNTGSEAATPKAVRLAVNGVAAGTDKSAGQIGPGQTRTVRFDHLFRATGAQSVTIEVEVDDDLAADNAQGRALLVRGGIEVLIIEGNNAPRFLERAGAFVQLALAPGMGGTVQLAEPETVAAEDAIDIQDFSRFETIILAGVPKLPVNVRKRIDDFVQSGGGLLVLHDERADPRFFNEWNLMPGKLESWTTPPPDAPEKVALSSVTHHALRKIADKESSDFSSVELRGYWTIGDASDGERGALFKGGAPFVLIRPEGKGTVMRLSTSLDNRNSNLATRDSFVPFVHEMVYFLANPAGSRLHLETTSPPTRIRFPAKTTAPLAGGDETLATYKTDAPDGATRQARIFSDGDRLAAEIDGEPLAGVYRIQIPADALELRALTTESATIPYSIARPAAESAMEFLSESDITRLNRYFPTAISSEVDASLDVLSGRIRGKELWKPLAVAAFILIVLEILLTRWIARGRRLDEDIEPQTAPAA